MPKTTLSFYLHIIAVAVIVFALGRALLPLPQAGESGVRVETAKESAYERVMRTGVLRCGYLVYPPYFVKDANSGEFSGMYYDIVEEMAKQLSLKIDWVEEVGFATMFEGFKNNKYDMVCQGIWALPSRAREADFTLPISFDSFYAFARAKDDRFLEDLDEINATDIRIVTLDGEISSKIANTNFPKAQQVTLSNMVNPTENLLNVATGKADVAISEMATALAYSEKNPGQIHLANKNPVRVGASTLPIPKNEFAFKQLLNTTIQSMHETGAIDRIIQKYEKYPGSFVRVATPYQLPTNAELGTNN